MASITKEMLTNLRGEIDNALIPIGEKYGIKFHAGNASYTQAVATFKLEVATIDNENGSVNTKEAEDFKINCFRYGLKKEHLGQAFSWFNGNKFTIIGCKPRSRKQPIIAINESGRRYKFSSESVLAALGEKD